MNSWASFMSPRLRGSSPSPCMRAFMPRAKLLSCLNDVMPLCLFVL